MKNVIFLTRRDRSHLAIVNIESQIQAMLTLKDLDGKPFLEFLDA